MSDTIDRFLDVCAAQGIPVYVQQGPSWATVHLVLRGVPYTGSSSVIASNPRDEAARNLIAAIQSHADDLHALANMLTGEAAITTKDWDLHQGVPPLTAEQVANIIESNRRVMARWPR